MTHDSNPKQEDFSKEVAHIEIDPSSKRPKKIPILKVIIYAVIFLVITSVLTYLLLLTRDREKFQKISKDVTTEVESKLKAYPRPLPNACGEEVKICPSGDVVEKSGFSCEFDACPDSANDMTKFWIISNAEEKYIRTYENLDLRYKFNLVKNWDFQGLDYGFIFYSPNYNCDEVIVSDTKSCDGTIIEMLTSNTTGQFDVEDWYESRENYFRINSDVDWPSTYEIKQIGGVKAVEVENALNNLSYFFIFDNTVFALKMVSASEIDYKNSLPHFNEIISSFQFTES